MDELLEMQAAVQIVINSLSGKRGQLTFRDNRGAGRGTLAVISWRPVRVCPYMTGPVQHGGPGRCFADVMPPCWPRGRVRATCVRPGGIHSPPVSPRLAAAATMGTGPLRKAPGDGRLRARAPGRQGG